MSEVPITLMTLLRMSTGVKVVFAPDTEMSIAAAVEMVNTARRRDGHDAMATVDDVAEFYTRWGYTARHDGDDAELAAVRDARDQIAALWDVDRDTAAGVLNEMLARGGAVPYLDPARRPGLAPARHRAGRPAGDRPARRDGDGHVRRGAQRRVRPAPAVRGRRLRRGPRRPVPEPLAPVLRRQRLREPRARRRLPGPSGRWADRSGTATSSRDEHRLPPAARRRPAAGRVPDRAGPGPRDPARTVRRTGCWLRSDARPGCRRGRSPTAAGSRPGSTGTRPGTSCPRWPRWRSRPATRRCGLAPSSSWRACARARWRAGPGTSAGSPTGRACGTSSAAATSGRRRSTSTTAGSRSTTCTRRSPASSTRRAHGSSVLGTCSTTSSGGGTRCSPTSTTRTSRASSSPSRAA